MKSEQGYYLDIIELLGALRSRNAVRNELNKVITRSEDVRLVFNLETLLEQFIYTSSNSLHIPVKRMSACKRQADFIIRYCERMLELIKDDSVRACPFCSKKAGEAG